MSGDEFQDGLDAAKREDYKTAPTKWLNIVCVGLEILLKNELPHPNHRKPRN